MSFTDVIKAKLEEALTPEKCKVEDVSYLHAGHQGARAGGESHFNVMVVSEAFKGLSRVARHKRVHLVLKEELKNQIHALSLQLWTPEEHDQQ